MMIKAPRGPMERIAAWRTDESGAARADRVVLVFGGIAVTALLAFSMIGRDDEPASLAGSAGNPVAGSAGAPDQTAPGPAAPERRIVSATGRAAPEPPQVEGQSTGPAAVSAGYMDRFEPRSDNEQAILSAQTEQAVAAEEEAARAAAEAAAPGSETAATADSPSDGS
jgi:hypothetical protein